MWHLIMQHPVISALSAAFVYSNAVGALPPPEQNASRVYRYFYSFNHGLAGNVMYAVRKLFPQYVAPDAPKS